MSIVDFTKDVLSREELAAVINEVLQDYTLYLLRSGDATERKVNNIDTLYILQNALKESEKAA